MPLQLVPTAADLGIDVGMIQGQILIGTFLSCILYGAICLEIFRYFRSFRDDSTYYKISVFLIWMFDTAHIVCGMHLSFFYLVKNYGLVQYLLFIPGTYSALLVITNCSGTIAHVNIIMKVWSLSNHNKFHATALLILVAMKTAMALATSIELATHPSFLRIHEFAWSISAGLSFGICSDVAVAGTLSLFLRKSRSGFPQSRVDPVVNMIIQYVIGCGAASCILVGGTLITYLSMTHNLVHIAIYMQVEKSYALSYLTILNSRTMLRALRGEDSTNPTTKVRLSTLVQRSQIGGDRNSVLPRFMDVLVTTNTSVTSDTMRFSRYDMSKDVTPNVSVHSPEKVIEITNDGTAIEPLPN
ncbi:hypothetical protein BD410DRAFT_368830 [Rickenella mellea]|uniref:DUF6534 domain-containing protein n=1 Tax=Rickenella mellea TaxID=50990 RepID=A0A4Y7PEH7_9AGAM|nr:hypothetical protein BD410DRAFT_368830 [Rickenella mellea]